MLPPLFFIAAFIAYAVKSGVENVSRYGVTLPTARTAASTSVKRDW